MNLKDFIELVKEMRQAQTAYFSSPSFKKLNTAKSLERDVDKCLNTYYSDLQRKAAFQLDLFNNME